MHDRIITIYVRHRSSTGDRRKSGNEAWRHSWHEKWTDYKSWDNGNEIYVVFFGKFPRSLLS